MSPARRFLQSKHCLHPAVGSTLLPPVGLDFLASIGMMITMVYLKVFFPKTPLAGGQGFILIPLVPTHAYNNSRCNLLITFWNLVTSLQHLILQIGKAKHREVKSVTLGHTAWKWQSCD